MANFLDDNFSAFIPWCQVRIGTSTGEMFHCFDEYVCFASLPCFRSCVKIGPYRVLRFGLLLIRLCFSQILLLILCGDILLNPASHYPGPIRYPYAVVIIHTMGNSYCANGMDVQMLGFSASFLLSARIGTA